MDTEQIRFYLNKLSEILSTRGVQGEIVIYGGAAMVLVLKARPSTKDVDAIFAPKEIIYQAAKEIENLHGAPENWLNDAVKGFIGSGERHKPFWDFPNLKVYTAIPEYLLAMKCISLRLGRGDTDLGDIRFLIAHLGLKSATEVFDLVEKYYPRNKISPKTQFAVEEIFETLKELPQKG
ncbi:MAG: DUF6036 family nucleotidyltransferase [Thermodesulfobacteriota bacterium]